MLPNESNFTVETPQLQEDAIKGVISATCRLNGYKILPWGEEDKTRDRSADRHRGPAIKRNTNFLREIKVIPYNISTIEHLLTKKCLIEVSDKCIQADGPGIQAIEYYNTNR